MLASEVIKQLTTIMEIYGDHHVALLTLGSEGNRDLIELIPNVAVVHKTSEMTIIPMIARKVNLLNVWKAPTSITLRINTDPIT
jgi:hypothetical protein